MAARDDGQVPDHVHALATPLAAEYGVDVLEVEVSGPQGRPLVRVVADVLDGDAEADLDVEVVAKLSRRLSEALDDDDLLPGPFTLEVTSPGVDRPLRTARDFKRNIGRDIEVTARADGEVTAGRLLSVDDQAVTLDVDGSSTTLALDDLDHGTVVLPW